MPGILERLLLQILPFTDISNESGDVYLRRFYLYRGKRRPHIYLHHIMRSDDDRALHDHPWKFTSLMLAGMYEEVTPYKDQNVENIFDVFYDKCYSGPLVKERIHAPAIIRHKAEDRHRLILRPGHTVWTLVFASEREREWGFWMRGKFVPWREFTAKMKSMGGRC